MDGISLSDFEKAYNQGYKAASEKILTEIRQAVDREAFPIGHEVDNECMVVGVYEIKKHLRRLRLETKEEINEQ